MSLWEDILHELDIHCATNFGQRENQKGYVRGKEKGKRQMFRIFMVLMAFVAMALYFVFH